MEPHERLAQARAHAKFPSARSAAIAHGWPESTYRSHENGTRGLSLQDAEKYGNAFGVSGRWIFYGDGRIELMVGKNKPLSNVGRRTDTVRYSTTRLPVFGRAMGGAEGQLIMGDQAVDTVECPPMLDGVPNAYALYVVGDSMEPRYRAGEVVYIHPGKPARRGDYVVVQIKGRGDSEPIGYIKQFISLTPTTLVLQQHNPPSEMEFRRDEVLVIHRIVFSGEA
jgi:phage repressor protein C with HTH and peptisase S24 domain